MFEVEIYDILNQNQYLIRVESKTPRDAKYDAMDKLCKTKGLTHKEYFIVNKILEVI